MNWTIKHRLLMDFFVSGKLKVIKMYKIYDGCNLRMFLGFGNQAFYFFGRILMVFFMAFLMAG
jgi:hypothetical protein